MFEALDVVYVRGGGLDRRVVVEMVPNIGPRASMREIQVRTTEKYPKGWVPGYQHNHYWVLSAWCTLMVPVRPYKQLEHQLLQQALAEFVVENRPHTRPLQESIIKLLSNAERVE